MRDFGLAVPFQHGYNMPGLVLSLGSIPTYPARSTKCSQVVESSSFLPLFWSLEHTLVRRSLVSFDPLKTLILFQPELIENAPCANPTFINNLTIQVGGDQVIMSSFSCPGSPSRQVNARTTYRNGCGEICETALLL
jgi:hypothetical protein